jgi:hypothetical protein
MIAANGQERTRVPPAPQATMAMNQLGSLRRDRTHLSSS